MGQKLSTDAAKAAVDDLYSKVADRWQQVVTQGEFMTSLSTGELPREAIKLFFRNWGAYTIEINTIVASTYQKHLTFFKKHRDLMAPMGEKIADEFMHPKPPGHFLVMLQTAKALGITEDEVFMQPLLPMFRGKIDFIRGLLYEGSVAEWWSSITTEEMIGYWSRDFRAALTKKYGFSDQEATYFGTHEEADLAEHEDGVMAHGSFNRAMLQRLLEDGMAEERPGYGLAYCSQTSVDLHAQMLQSALEAYKKRG